MNPVAHADGLKLNITDSDNALDLELAREVAGYFRVSREDSTDIIERIQDVIRLWPEIANALGMSRSEQERMALAFRTF